MSKQKSFLLVSLGSIGRRHLRVLREAAENAHIVLFRSGKGNRHEEEKLADYITTDFSKALETPYDGAIISNPANLHLSFLEQICSRGTPVMVEKPLAADYREAQEVRSKIDEIDRRRILVGYVIRHSRSMNFFKALLEKRGLSNIEYVEIVCSSYLPDWRPGIDYRESVSASRELGGGVLLELSHEIDYANWIFGPFKNINAEIYNTGSLQLLVPDTSRLVLETCYGFYVTLRLDFCSKTKERRVEVAMGNELIEWDGVKQIVSSKGRFDSDSKETIFNDDTADDWYIRQMQHFLSFSQAREEPIASFDDGLEVLKIIQAAEHSSEKTGLVNL